MIDVTQISIVHTIFNVVNTLLLFPFAGSLVYLAEHLVKGKNEAKPGELQHLDERLFETPSFAVENAVKEVVRMGEIEIKCKRFLIQKEKLMNCKMALISISLN